MNIMLTFFLPALLLSKIVLSHDFYIKSSPIIPTPTHTLGAWQIWVSVAGSVVTLGTAAGCRDHGSSNPC